MNFTKTKIVCTIGPSSSKDNTIKEMIKAGMDVARVNFSHGSYDEHSRIIRTIRKISNDIAILIDLSGPKFRIGEVKKPFDINKGEKLILTSENIIGDAKRISVNHEKLPEETKPGNHLYINDGQILLRVDAIENDQDIHTTCLIGGTISSKKGLNAPEVPISLYFPTPKDIEDAKFALEFDPDYFAASFIRRNIDLETLRHLIENNYKKAQIISKIEHRDAIKNFESILEASDGIMVARGDLGIEIATEDVPIVQKDLIRRCNEVGKPVITATQMLESMTLNKRPTRAEASDVSNAVIDGSDAVMLSAETATGRYPVETIEYMNKIAQRAESILSNLQRNYSEKSLVEVLGHASYIVSSRLPIQGIIAITRTGSTAKLIAKYRPNVPIIGATSFMSTYRQLQLVWGVNPLLIDIKTNTDQIILESIEKSLEKEYITERDRILVVTGTLLGIPSKTNLLQVIEVNDLLSVSGLVMKGL